MFFILDKTYKQSINRHHGMHQQDKQRQNKEYRVNSFTVQVNLTVQEVKSLKKIVRLILTTTELKLDFAYRQLMKSTR